MKNNILKTILLLNLAMLALVSCNTRIPTVKNAQYSTFSTNEEKGYIVDFEVSHDSIPPSAVVINRIQQNIGPGSKTDKKYKIRVLTQSQKVFGFKANVTDRPNGIFFKTDTAEVFKPVEFKLKK